jgi:hypothetical protein
VGSNTVALNVQPPPQVPGPLDQYRDAMSVQSLINQTKLQQQAQQQNVLKQQSDQLQLQAQQREEDNLQKATQLYHDSGGDMNKFIQGLPDADISPDYANKMILAHVAMQENFNKMQKSQLDLNDAHSKVVAQAMNAYKATQGQPPEARATAWNMLGNQLQLENVVKPRELPDSPPDDNWVQQRIDYATTVGDYVKNARENQAATAALPETKAKAAAAGLSTAAQIFNGANDQMGWNTRLAIAEKTLPPELFSQIPKQYSPQAAAQIQQMGISPEKQMSLPDEKQAIKDYLAQKGMPDTPANRNKARVWYQGIKPGTTNYYSSGGPLGPGAGANPGAGPAPPSLPGGPASFGAGNGGAMGATAAPTPQGGAQPNAQGPQRPTLSGGPATTNNVGATPTNGTQGGPTPPAIPGGPQDFNNRTSPTAPIGSSAGFDVSRVPGQIRAQVQAVLDHRSPMPPQGRPNMINSAVRQWVNVLDPTYDETTYGAKNKILQSYTSGAESKSINAINTAMGHADELGQAIDALGNGNVRVLNGLAQKYQIETGSSDAPTVFRLIVNRLAPEMASAYIQGGGGEGERGMNAKDFDPTLAPQLIRSNLAESIKLLRSKIGAQEQQWNTTYQPTNDRDQFQNRFLTPQAKQALDWGTKNAPGGNAANVPSGFTRIKASDGSTHDIPTAALDRAKKRDPNLTVVQ